MKRFWFSFVISAGLTTSQAQALTGTEYLQLDATHRAVHVMGMVEAFKYADDLTGDGVLSWLFDCIGGWSGTQLESVFTNYLNARPLDARYEAPSLFVSAIGNVCPNAPMWAKD